MNVRLDCNNLSKIIDNNAYNKTKQGPFPLYEKSAEDIDFKFLSNAPANVKKAWNTTWNSIESKDRMNLIVGMIELKYMNHSNTNGPINSVNGYKDWINSFLDDTIDMDKSGLCGGNPDFRNKMIEVLSEFEKELSKYK